VEQLSVARGRRSSGRAVGAELALGLGVIGSILSLTQAPAGAPAQARARREPEPSPYPEQVLGLAAVHAVNSLLQGPYYKGAEDVIRIINTENENLVPTARRAPLAKDVLLGYVSVQVIDIVLAQHSLGLLEPEHEEREALEGEQGFLCHNDTHCFTLRRLHDLWFSSLCKSPSPPPPPWLPYESLAACSMNGQLFH